MTLEPPAIWNTDIPDLRDALAELQGAVSKNDIRVDKKAVGREIKEAVEHYVFRRRNQEAEIVGAPRKKRLEELRDKVEGLISEYELMLATPKLINPLIWALEPDPDFQDASETENKIKNLIRQLTLHRNWLIETIEAASTSVRPRGRPTGSMERDLLCLLADIYENCTHREAGRSAPPDQEGEVQQYYGPFVRFVNAVVAASPLLSSLNKKWNTLIDETLRARRRDPDTEERKDLLAGRQLHLMDRYGNQLLKEIMVSKE